MRIALSEIDPHIAAMITVMAPGQAAKSLPKPHRNRRMSRRKRVALALTMSAPPIIGFQLACLVANTYHAYGWLPWVVWFGTSGALTVRSSVWLLRGEGVSRRTAAVMALNGIAAPALGLASVFALLSNGGSYPYLSFSVWSLWLAVSTFVALLGNRVALSIPPKVDVITELQPETMRDVFASLSLSRAERVYCDALLFLARAQPGPQTELTMRETLQQFNGLLESSRQLEEQRRSLLPLLGANVVPELRAEYDRLKQRLENTSDAVTRASLEQSLRMVMSRIDDAHTLQVGLERLNSQQEAVTQTLSSALSALARMQISPDTQFDSSAVLAMNEIAETVTQINQQTIAVENAVDEVLTLRASNGT